MSSHCLAQTRNVSPMSRTWSKCLANVSPRPEMSRQCLAWARNVSRQCLTRSLTTTEGQMTASHPKTAYLYKFPGRVGLSLGTLLWPAGSTHPVGRRMRIKARYDALVSRLRKYLGTSFLSDARFIIAYPKRTCAFMQFYRYNNLP